MNPGVRKVLGATLPILHLGLGACAPVLNNALDPTTPRGLLASVAFVQGLDRTAGTDAVLAPARLVINEIIWNSPAGPDDAVELYNAGDIAIDLAAEGIYL